MINFVKTKPTLPALTLDQAKMHARVDEDLTDEDDWFQEKIEAATEELEQILQRSIMPQVRVQMLSAFPADGRIRLDYPKVRSLVSVKYLDAVTANEQTLDADTYTLINFDDKSAAFLVRKPGKQWPTALSIDNGVSVEYNAGYVDANAVPMGIKQWIGMLVATWYHKREMIITTDRGTTHEVPLDFGKNVISRFMVYTNSLGG